MSRIQGFVIGPAGAPPPYYVHQQAPCPQVVQHPVNTVIIPPAPPGTRVIINRPTQVVYGAPAPMRSVVCVNRSQPGQLGVIGGRLGTSIGNIVDSALGPPPPQVTVYHQYTTPAQGNQPQFVQYPNAAPPSYTAQGYTAQQQSCQDYKCKPAVQPN